MVEHTYKDIIISPDDSRIAIGRRYWFGDTPHECLWRANKAKDTWNLIGVKHDMDYPFETEHAGWACMILEKEPKYVPFDLSLEEDRARLREAWIRPKGRPSVGLKIIAMNIDCVFFHGEKGQSTEDLFMEYEFIDGSPCGKLVEVE